MEKYDVRFLESAMLDLEEITAYIAADNKSAADEFRMNLIEKAASLETFPLRGRSVPDIKISSFGFRTLTVGKYLMFYRVEGSFVYIYRVLNGRRDYPAL